MHVQRLRDVIRAHLHDPHEFAAAWDTATEAELVPWYRENVEEDRARIAEIEALRNGLEPAPRRDASAVLREALLAAVPHDPDAFRAFLASRCCLTPLRETFANQQLVERILELANDSERPPLAGPNRAQLLQLLDRSLIEARPGGATAPPRAGRPRPAFVADHQHQRSRQPKANCP